jgi:glutamine synthetase
MTMRLEANDPIKGSAYRLAFTLPRHQSEALAKFNASRPLREIFGERFVDALTAVKEAEFEAYNRVISSWERENLLLNV